MKEKDKFRFYEQKSTVSQKVNYRINQVTNTFFEREYKPAYKVYCGRKVMSRVEANRQISAMIEEGKPFWVGRFGNTEMRYLLSYLKKLYGYHTDDYEQRLTTLCKNAGFFPAVDTMAEEYAKLILDCIGEIDIHAIWPMFMEDYFLSQYEPDAKLIRMTSLEPWSIRHEKTDVLPWSHSLKGRKVLVVHPFEESIRKQYENNREVLFAKAFPNADDILPSFELKTIKAVQTAAGNRDERFNTWFEALGWMIEECHKTDFDIAILGCGAYGMPLAHQIKKMGKQAIQLCGATQLMFGILGKRWEGNERFKRELFNEYWIHPSSDETLMNKEKVEGGCYW